MCLSPCRSRLAWFVVASLLLGLPALFGMVSFAPASIDAAGRVIGQSSTVVLDPEEWLGKRFPLLEQIDIGDRLSGGTWTIVLHRHSCPSCRRVLEHYVGVAEQARQRGLDPRIALIEIPPFGADAGMPPVSSACVSGRLSAAHAWFVKVPLIVEIDDGRVIATR